MACSNSTSRPLCQIQRTSENGDFAADLNRVRGVARATSTAYTIRFNTASDTYQIGTSAQLLAAAAEEAVNLTDSPYHADISAVSLGGNSDLIFDGFGAPDSDGQVRLRCGSETWQVNIDTTGNVTVSRV